MKQSGAKHALIRNLSFEVRRKTEELQHQLSFSSGYFRNALDSLIKSLSSWLS
jgi:hypothetical protein